MAKEKNTEAHMMASFDFGKLLGGFGGLGILAVSGLLQTFGQSLKNQDDNSTGYDDAGGNICIAIAPVIPAFVNGNEKTVRKALIASYNAIGNYLGFEPRELPTV